ncbi:general stress protein [Candidatus Nitromaritima sp. SCGC AAA799-A02]|nr:general stress protein [Candidatus Nitromaritima sp. SCGC AAA799-A02]KMP11753.1 general stress protein [Candidatus Nitromaritima sp. SCGC AAA799-C22]
MRYAKCRGIDKKWSVITFGCWQIAPSEGWGDICPVRDADAAVKAALDCGITAFDTAEGYGDGESERRLGNALGSKKNDVIVISKIWPDAALAPTAYRERLDNTLRALNRDHVDVYLIHFPSNYFNTPEKSEKLCDLMEGIKKSGKAVTVGLSNFRKRDLSRLGKGIRHFCVNQIPYNLLQREYEGETRDTCRKAGIPYMAYSPTAQGLLAGRVSKEALNFPARRWNDLYQEPLFSKSKSARDTINAIAGELGTRPIAVALAWVLAQDNFLTAIVGSRKAAQVPEFAAAGDLKLNADQLRRLSTASDAFLK